MPNYGGVGDINLRLTQYSLGPFGGASTPNEDEIDGLMDQVEAEVDGALVSVQYTVPLTATEDINAVKRFVVEKTASLVYDMLISSDTDAAAVAIWRKNYDVFIKSIVDGKFSLPSQLLPTSVPVGIQGSIYNRDLIFDSLLPPVEEVDN